MTEEFCDVGGGITLCYERFGDPADPSMLLVMGLGTQMIAWHDDFCRELADHGFHVIRFDNRDVGRSTHMDFRPPTTMQLITRRFYRKQYRLGDMGEDTAGLIRELGLAPAHVVGVSMGGMIAQTLAAEHPELVRSLTSIMSSTGSRLWGRPAPSVYKYLLRPPPRDREAYIERSAEIFGVVGSTGFDRDEDYVRERAGRSFDRGHSLAGSGRQLGAVLASGNRTKRMKQIRVPTLVLHGTVDRLINVSGGKATARAIPGAKLKLIEGMGHDLPRGAWPQLIGAIAEHAHAADRDAGRAGERPTAATA